MTVFMLYRTVRNIRIYYELSWFTLFLRTISHSHSLCTISTPLASNSLIILCHSPGFNFNPAPKISLIGSAGVLKVVIFLPSSRISFKAPLPPQFPQMVSFLLPPSNVVYICDTYMQIFYK